MKALILVSCVALCASACSSKEISDLVGKLEATPTPTAYVPVKNDRSYFDSYSLAVAQLDAEYRSAQSFSFNLLANRKETRLAKIRAGLKQGVGRFMKVQLNDLERDQERRLVPKDIGIIVGLANRADKLGVEKILTEEPKNGQSKAEERAVLVTASAPLVEPTIAPTAAPIVHESTSVAPAAMQDEVIFPVDPIAPIIPRVIAVDPVVPENAAPTQDDASIPLVEPTVAPIVSAPAPAPESTPVAIPESTPVVIATPKPTPEPLPVTISDVRPVDFSMSGNEITWKKTSSECAKASISYGGSLSGYAIADCPEFVAYSRAFFEKVLEEAPPSSGWDFQVQDRNGIVGWAAKLPIMARYYKILNDEEAMRDALLFVQPDGSLRLSYFVSAQ